MFFITQVISINNNFVFFLLIDWVSYQLMQIIPVTVARLTGLANTTYLLLSMLV